MSLFSGFRASPGLLSCSSKNKATVLESIRCHGYDYRCPGGTDTRHLYINTRYSGFQGEVILLADNETWQFRQTAKP